MEAPCVLPRGVGGDVQLGVPVADHGTVSLPEVGASARFIVQ